MPPNVYEFERKSVEIQLCCMKAGHRVFFGNSSGLNLPPPTGPPTESISDRIST